MDPMAELALHLRLLAGDPVAAEECARLWLGKLVGRLAATFPAIARVDEHLIEAAVEEALLNYIGNPHSYNPERGRSLGSYLFYSARGDLLNAWRSEQKWRNRTVSLQANEAVELSLSDGNDPVESTIVKAEADEQLRRVLLEFSEQRDRDLLVLMLSGERKTQVFAACLGVEYEPEGEQRKIVKRHKDRIAKRLSRMKEQQIG